MSPADDGDQTGTVVRAFFEANAQAKEPLHMPLAPEQRVAFLFGTQRPGSGLCRLSSACVRGLQHLPTDISRLILMEYAGPPRYTKRFILPFDFTRSAAVNLVKGNRIENMDIQEKAWGSKWNAEVSF